ncbi:unnamed protein product [Bursaphelenchus xylophilus]|uniref:(pine wood nematode) hypothetical protein n=1 Tax=Bursaphelenchus xylophilus TaxID=6326 RepID=A0A1I7SEN9_BURXY|nr:unnamed protein product [Bursaphelenchus xylophilus]CAG9092873.1 unnamed protein product [Bursaphelenchus xylophilus]
MRVSISLTTILLLYIPQYASGIEQKSQVNLDFELKKEPGDKYYRADIKDDDVVDIYQKWVDTGLSSLMSAIANHKLKRQRRSVIQKYGECSSSATDIPKHARCLSKLLKNEIKPEVRKRPHRLQKYRKEIEGFKTDFSQDPEGLHLPKRRGRRSPKIQASDSYTLKTNKEQMTPLGHIAKVLMESVKKLKGKSEIPKWQRTVEKLKTNGAKRKRYQEMIENDSEESLQNMQLGLMKEKMGRKKTTANDIDVEGLIKDPKALRKLMKSKKIPKTKEDKVVGMIKGALKLIYSLAGENTTNFEERNMKLVSPRFLGVVPEEKKDDEISLISPSLFSLHDQGEGIENLTSLPNLLKGFSSQDQQLWLDIIMEAAGVNEESERLEQDINEINKTRSLMTNITNLVDENGTPLYATKENATELGMSPEHIEMFEKFHTNYSKEQLREMNTTGYSILKPHQIEMIYGPNSPYADAAVYNRLMNMTEEQIRDHLHDDFQRLAELEHFKIDENEFAKSQTNHHDRRKKRQLLSGLILSPVSFTWLVLNPLLASQPFILSPVIFTPLILSPSLFGPIILTPWIFVPLVLSPRILGAIILSPFMFNPLILSPFALHPAILSPGLFTPLVLSPLLMVPFILSPQVFTPIILSPLCMSPLILNPMVGSPLILSPFVLSPIIASPMALSALVLSPYALSPVIWSPLIVFAAVLSPSWLS